ncbi:hypothetical protein MTO96_046038 [Rhipicephalus appendiculatus]
MMRTGRDNDGGSVRYNDLLGMPLWSFTMERKDDVLKKRDRKREELEVLRRKSPENLWEEDLDAFPAKLDEVEQAQREEENATGVKTTKGGRTENFWPAHAPIPVNYIVGQSFYVPAASFAVSWALGFGLRDLVSVISKMTSSNLFSAGSWRVLLCRGTTQALKAAEKTKLNADAMINVEGSEAPPAPVIGVVPITIDDVLPLLYRCWSPVGHRIHHVPLGDTWTDVQLKPDAVICLPDIMTLTAIYGGFYKFTTSMPPPLFRLATSC